MPIFWRGTCPSLKILKGYMVRERLGTHGWCDPISFMQPTHISSFYLRLTTSMPDVWNSGKKLEGQHRGFLSRDTTWRWSEHTFTCFACTPHRPVAKFWGLGVKYIFRGQDLCFMFDTILGAQNLAGHCPPRLRAWLQRILTRISVSLLICAIDGFRLLQHLLSRTTRSIDEDLPATRQTSTHNEAVIVNQPRMNFRPTPL